MKREMGREDGRTDERTNERGQRRISFLSGSRRGARRSPSATQSDSQPVEVSEDSVSSSLPRRMDEAARGDDFLYKTVGVVRWISLPR